MGRWASFRAIRCPLCGSDDITNWTCPPCTSLVAVHRELVRNLQQWRSLFEAMEVPDVLVASDSRSYSLWDVQVFYEQRVSLPSRMAESIQFCLYENMKERDAAVRMGVKASNPVSVYATIGLTTLLGKAVKDELPGYSLDFDEAARGVSHV